MSDEKRIETASDLDAVLNAIRFAPSGVRLHEMDLLWEITFTSAPAGWLIRLTFMRPDTLTGQMGRGCGRWEFVPIGTTESGVVKTAWLLLELLVRHELMEAFHYGGVRIFNPHHTVDELSMPARAKDRA